MICLQTDGHGETSMPPYNFVAGGIKIENRKQTSSLSHQKVTYSLHNIAEKLFIWHSTTITQSFFNFSIFFSSLVKKNSHNLAMKINI